MDLKIIPDLRARHFVPVEKVAFGLSTEERQAMGPIESAASQVRAAADAGWFGAGITGEIVDDMEAADLLRVAGEVNQHYAQALGLDPKV